MSKIYRVDSRLVHAQTINYWCKEYEITNIIVVNDELAIDNFKQLFFKIATPNEITLQFASIKDVSNINYNENKNYMILFEGVKDVVRYIDNVEEITELLISNVKCEVEDTEIFNSVSIGKEDKELIKGLLNKNNIKIIYGAMPK